MQDDKGLPERGILMARIMDLIGPLDALAEKYMLCPRCGASLRKDSYGCGCGYLDYPRLKQDRLRWRPQ